MPNWEARLNWFCFYFFQNIFIVSLTFILRSSVQDLLVCRRIGDCRLASCPVSYSCLYDVDFLQILLTSLSQLFSTFNEKTRVKVWSVYRCLFYNSGTASRDRIWFVLASHSFIVMVGLLCIRYLFVNFKRLQVKCLYRLRYSFFSIYSAKQRQLTRFIGYVFRVCCYL